MKDTFCYRFGFAFAVRVRLTFAALAACCVIAPGVALAKCPPPKSEAQHIAAGAIVFTGKVKAVGPIGRAPVPDYADFEVSDAPERMIRVYASNNGLYTAVFKLGETYRIVAYRGERGLETFLCLVQRL